jgi:RNA polymerase sigma-70 factor (ECF subfamily)
VDELSEQIEDCSISVEEKLELKDTSMRIRNIMYRLDEPYREVFLLRNINGLSFKKISDYFNKNENWACVTYHRACKKIKSEMEDSQ